MNRLILIGNGFDLAHGLKTKYSDFIDWYWREWGKRLKMSHIRMENDRFCSFTLSNVHYDWFNTLHSKYQIITHLNQPDDLEIAETAKQNPELCNFSFRSPLFEKICEEVETKNWVDIEDVYYYFLKSSDNPKQINDDLEFLKNKLIDYLKSLQEATVNPYIQKQILDSFHWEDIAISSMNKWDKKMEPDDIMLLNFNYTNTADMYLPKAYNYSVNHIHGSLSNPESVIFGYGDERDNEYNVLMDKR